MMESLELVRPGIKYRKSFLSAVAEMQSEEKWQDKSLSEIEKDFEGYIKKFEDEEKGINLPEGYVPHTRLWLVEGGEFIGQIDIRHTLNENLMNIGGHIGYTVRPSKRKMGYGTKMLEMALPIAKDLGIDRVLVTCNDNNVGSAKIIEKNGGILKNKVEHEGRLKRRYWVNL